MRPLKPGVTSSFHGPIVFSHMWLQCPIYSARRIDVATALSMPRYAGRIVVGLCEDHLAYTAILQRGKVAVIRAAARGGHEVLLLIASERR